MRGIRPHLLAISGRRFGRPAGRFVQDGATFRDLEKRNAHAMGKLAKISRLFLVDPLDGRQVTFELPIQSANQDGLHEHENAAREHTDHQRKDGRVPQGEPDAKRRHADAHGRSSRRTNPTPRTVWSIFVSNGSSTFRRRRAMVTSITLSRGVARAVTRHTSRASISLDTTWPPCRSRNSRISNSFSVSSSGCPPRTTRRVTRSMDR